MAYAIALEGGLNGPVVMQLPIVPRAGRVEY